MICAHKGSIYGALNSQHILQGFRVALQVCVWLSNFVHKHIIVLDHVEMAIIGED